MLQCLIYCIFNNPIKLLVAIRPSNSIWPHLSYDLVRSKREYCQNWCSVVVVLCTFYRCTIIWAAHRFGLPDLASSHWVHSLCSITLCVLDLYSCVISACMLYYCNTVRWAWLDWGLSGWLTTLLQCFDTVGGWVIRPVRHRLWNGLNWVEWDVKTCST